MRFIGRIIPLLSVLLFTGLWNANAQKVDIFVGRNAIFSTIADPEVTIRKELKNLTDTSVIHNDTNKITHQLQLIQAFQLHQSPDSAWLILNQCRRLLESSPRKFCNDKDYWWVANTYYKHGQNDKAKWWIDSALTRVDGSGALILKQAYLQVLCNLFKQDNNSSAALNYQILADSVAQIIVREDYKAKQDSFTAVVSALKDSLRMNERIWKEKQAEYEAKFLYWLISFLIVILILGGLLLYFILRKRKHTTYSENRVAMEDEKLSAGTVPITEEKIRRNVTNIYGLTSLLLDKPRSGEDLTFLKSLGNQSLELFRFLRPEAPFTDNLLDEEKIIKKLKGIRLLIISTDPILSLFLKEFLKRKIRLCTINTIDKAEGIDTTQADVLIADEVKNNLDHISNLPVIQISSVGRKGIIKPFVIDELLQALMDVYEPSVKNDLDLKKGFKQEEVTGNDSLSKLEELNKQFSEARLTKDKDRILSVVLEIQKNIRDESNKKWFDTVLLHHEELTDLQLELALRNIQTFLQRKI